MQHIFQSFCSNMSTVRFLRIIYYSKILWVWQSRYHCVPRSPKWLKTGLKKLVWIFIHTYLVVNPSTNMKKNHGGISEKNDFLYLIWKQRHLWTLLIFSSKCFIFSYENSTTYEHSWLFPLISLAKSVTCM